MTCTCVGVGIGATCSEQATHCLSQFASSFCPSASGHASPPADAGEETEYVLDLTPAPHVVEQALHCPEEPTQSIVIVQDFDCVVTIGQALPPPLACVDIV